MHRYTVKIDDNFHYQDETARTTYGSFSTAEEAANACKKIVDEELEEWRRNGVSCEDLYQTYMMFGSDPFIVSNETRVEFSAWDYAKERCARLASEATFRTNK